jgi:small neutral amino acid transporter SnatA (MarC family)
MIDPSAIFTGFFVTLGPLKTLGPFAQRTRDVSPSVVRQIAFWAFIVATIGSVGGGLIGRALLTKWHVSLPALMLTGGIVFFMVALRQLLEQYEPPRLPAPLEPLPASPLGVWAVGFHSGRISHAYQLPPVFAGPGFAAAELAVGVAT